MAVDTRRSTKHHTRHKAVRLAVAATVGTLAGTLTPTPHDAGPAAHCLVAFTVAALAFAVPLLVVMLRADADETVAYVGGLDAGRSFVDVIALVAALGSLAGIGMMFLASGTKSSAGIAEASIAVGTIVSAWILVPTVYAMRYARHWFNAQPDCIDLHMDGPPRYSDFVYLAFTIAMSFAVSDTDLKTSQMRRLALHQAWLSYALGTVIIAATINLVAGLAP